jgi:hypothetical protein
MESNKTKLLRLNNIICSKRYGSIKILPELEMILILNIEINSKEYETQGKILRRKEITQNRENKTPHYSQYSYYLWNG